MDNLKGCLNVLLFLLFFGGVFFVCVGIFLLVLAMNGVKSTNYPSDPWIILLVLVIDGTIIVPCALVLVGDTDRWSNGTTVCVLFYWILSLSIVLYLYITLGPTYQHLVPVTPGLVSGYLEVLAVAMLPAAVLLRKKRTH